MSSEEHSPDSPKSPDREGEYLAIKRIAKAGLRLDPRDTLEQQRAVIEEVARLSTLEYWPEMEEDLRRKTVERIANSDNLESFWAQFRQGWREDENRKAVPVDQEAEGPEVLYQAFFLTADRTLRLRLKNHRNRDVR